MLAAAGAEFDVRPGEPRLVAEVRGPSGSITLS
jgi:hypothetical protein